MALHDAFDNCLELAPFGGVDRIVQILTGNGAVGRNYHDIHVVNFAEFIFLSLSRTGHAGQLLVHAEVVLQCNGRKGLRLLAHGNAFLCLNSLMQAIAVAPPEHQAARKFIYDYDFAFFYNVIHIAPHQIVGLQRNVHVVVDFHIFGVGEVFDAKGPLALGYAILCQCDRSLFFVYGKVLFEPQCAHHAVGPLV